MEAITENIYRIKVPLPNNNLRFVNCYLIKGVDRSLLIDTGFDLPLSAEILNSAIHDIGVDRAKLDIFVTHMHPDHVGAAYRIVNEDRKVYVKSRYGGLDLSGGLSDEENCAVGKNVSRDDGAVEEENGPVFQNYLSHWETPAQGYTDISENNELKVGEYTLRCIETPGHHGSCTCLWEEKRGILFSGDHVLQRITPNILDVRDNEGNLKIFIESLNKVATMPAKLVLPGHGEPFTDLAAECSRLIEHHQKRLENVIDLIEQGNHVFGEIARKCTWKNGTLNWDEMPAGLKFFAFGETRAHLNYLIELGRVEKCLDGKEEYYLI